MNCDEVRELLSEYLDGFLSEDKKVEVERHLQSCSVCQKELKQLENISFAIEKLPDAPLPEDFNVSLHQKLMATKQDRPNRFYQKGWVKTVSVLAAALIIVVALSSSNAIMNLLPNTSNQTQDFGASNNSVVTEEAPAEGNRNFKAAMDSDVAADSSAQSPSDDSITYGVDESATAAQKQIASVDRKIVSSAYVQLEVLEYQTTFDALSQLAEKYQGYVAASDTYYDTDGNASGGHLTIKVDAKSFGQAIEDVKQYGTVTSINYSTNDITSDYYDVQGRIEQYELQESRLMDIMAQAKTVSDMVTVEQELAKVRVALDSLKGQMQLYDQLTTLSTIDVDMVAPAPDTTSLQPGVWDNIGSKIKAGFVAGFNYLLSWLAKMLVTIVFILPIAIIVAIILIVVWQIVKHRSKKKIE